MTSDDESNTLTRQQTTLGSDTDHDDMAIDDENLGAHFEDQDLHALLAEAAGSEISDASIANRSPVQERAPARGGPSINRITPKWMQNKGRGRPVKQEKELDDEVPASLMLEETSTRETSPILGRNQRRNTGGEHPSELPPPVPGPSSRKTNAQWERAKEQQRLHNHDPRPPPVAPSTRHGTGKGGARWTVRQDPKEQALYEWAQMQDIDGTLDRIYNYYEQKGIWSAVLRQVLWLLYVTHLSDLLALTNNSTVRAPSHSTSPSS